MYRKPEKAKHILKHFKNVLKLRSKRDRDRCPLRGSGKSLTQLDFKFMLTDTIDEARELRRNRFYPLKLERMSSLIGHDSHPPPLLYFHPCISVLAKC